MNLAVGESITVWGNRTPIAIRAVAAVKARKVIDSAGNEWNARDGHRWGTSSEAYYTGTTIMATGPDDHDMLRLAKAKRQIEKVAEALKSFSYTAKTLSDIEPYMLHITELGKLLKVTP